MEHEYFISQQKYDSDQGTSEAEHVRVVGLIPGTTKYNKFQNPDSQQHHGTFNNLCMLFPFPSFVTIIGDFYSDLIGKSQIC